jgi:hypothetical protein
MRVLDVKGFEVLVDDDIYEFASQYVWRFDKDGYVLRTGNKDGKRTRLYLHKMVLPSKEGLYVDHINRNKLDNRRENLRYATYSQSGANKSKLEGSTSQYKGVYKHPVNVKGKTYEYWVAKVKKDGKVLFKKTFKDEIEAAKAYDREALKTHGEYAVLNFPELL